MYKWDAEEGLRLIQKEKVTSFIAAPAITGDLVNAYDKSRHDISTLLILGGGGAHRAPEQVKEIDSLNEIIMPQIGWGMTETNAIGTSAIGDAYADRPSSCGECSAVLQMRCRSLQIERPKDAEGTKNNHSLSPKSPWRPCSED